MELLFEILSEELPVDMQHWGEDYFKQYFAAQLANSSIIYSELKSYSTPRRIAITINGMQEDLTAVQGGQTKRGPRAGSDPSIIESFAKSAGCEVGELQMQTTPKGDFYFASIKNEKTDLQTLIKNIATSAMQSCKWPKSMTVSCRGDGGYAWVRPISNIMCLLSGKPLDIKFHNIFSTNYTFGHRFLSDTYNKKIIVTSAKDYLQKMRENFVMLGHADRAKFILEQGQKLAAHHKLYIHAEGDALLGEIAGLVEWPMVLMGKIDDKFLHLPKELLVTTMEQNQRYFLLTTDSGCVAQYFIFVANSGDPETVIHGNEKVLRARLEDALYFFNHDLKTDFKTLINELARITFHHKLGTMQGRVGRISSILGALCKFFPAINVDDAQRAAGLMKLDLCSKVVQEFPELQGIMGKYYALHSGESTQIADAIAEHYYPKSAQSRCPRTDLPICLALADKIDALSGLFLAGVKLTSSKDQFGLRRLALGIIRIIIENKLTLQVTKIIDKSFDIYRVNLPELPNESAHKGVHNFLIDRYKFFLRTKFQPSVVEMITDMIIDASDNESVLDRMFEIYQFVEIFSNFSESEFDVVVTTLKRLENILPKEMGVTQPACDAQLFVDDAETGVYSALCDYKTVCKTGSHAQLGRSMMALIYKLQHFFDTVTVNADDIAIRQNRIALLYEVHRSIKSGIKSVKLIEVEIVE